MYDFENVIGTTKDEQIRAWAVDKAIEQLGHDPRKGAVIEQATEIEKFIKDGSKTDG